MKSEFAAVAKLGNPAQHLASLAVCGAGALGKWRNWNTRTA